MNAELVILGRSISMAQQSRRRMLVAIIYCILGFMLAGSYVFGSWRTISPYIIWAVIFACRLFLGGYASGGLVKPFNGKAPNQSEAPPLLALKLRIYRPLPGDGSSLYRNDEREMSQRDRAHYLAYQALGISLIVPWAAASLLGDPRLFGWDPANINHLCAVLLLAVLTLFLTLPQSILLWTEPDMEEP